MKQEDFVPPLSVWSSLTVDCEFPAVLPVRRKLELSLSNTQSYFRSHPKGLGDLACREAVFDCLFKSAMEEKINVA